MKKIRNTIYLLTSFFVMSSVQAHDPSLHTKAEKPKCEAMKDMEHSNMDTDDHVMMAMMKKCMSKEPTESDSYQGDNNHEDADSMEEVDQHNNGHNH